MNLTTLKETPQFKEAVLELIEKEFGYDSSNSFEIDFYPLINDSNHEHCHILIENNRLVAHIGALKRHYQIEENTFDFMMYGGIAVASEFQGQGNFKKLFEHVLSLYQDSTFHLLWSDKIDLYKKFSFFPCIELHQYQGKDNKEAFPRLYQIKQSYLIDLDNQTLLKIKDLYQSSKELRPHRDEKHWQDLTCITSAKIYLIYKDDELVNYFIKDKGQDLTNIIHEYGTISKEYLSIMLNYGIVWSPQVFSNNETLFAALLKIGNFKKFSQFVKAYSPLQINEIDEDIVFKFKENSHAETHEGFLQGLFGPGKFEEFSTSPLLIPGLDSI